MRAVRLVAVAVVVAGVALIARPYVHGLSFVVRAADMQGTPRRLADLDTIAEREREIAIPIGAGTMRARAYEPAQRATRAALLVSGLHASGIDEPRLVRLARQLSRSGLVVVTPDIPELSRFEIAPAITDDIERAARWLAVDSGLSPDRRVAMMGISFSGGLSVVAAGRPTLADHVAYVFALGGHDDLPRVLRYLCTGQEPYPPGEVRLKADTTNDRGTRDRGVRLQPDQDRGVRLEADRNAVYNRPPHDYGVAIVLMGVAERVVPARQVDALRAAVRRFLWASALDGGVDRAKAADEFAAVRALERTLPEPSATLLRYVTARDVAHLGPRLLPYVAAYGRDPALSASKSSKPSAPVFLLHGTEDNVIPPVESEYLADDLRGHAPTRLLLSGLISHAEADRPPTVHDVMELASFWGDLLAR
jgi:dienelactone hydrolase